MSRICFARSATKYRNLTCVGVILASIALIYGCASDMSVTKNYEHRIRMTKAEAVRFLEQYLREEKNLSVDENHLAFTYKRIVNVTYSLAGTKVRTNLYHWEEIFADIEFARVVKIRKVRFPNAEYLHIYDHNGVDLSGGFEWNRIDDRFISALLALCPNAESSASDADPADEIHQSIVQGNSAKLLSLLEGNPGLINAKTDYGTPLYIAAENGKKDAAVLLIEKGAKVDESIKKIGGEFTPLSIAAGNGHKDVVDLLLAKGADVHAKTDRGFTPLHFAAFNNRGDVVELLVAKGAQVNAKSNGGLTPLYSAAEKNSMDAAKLLIAGGAEIDAMDTNGFSPLHVAAGNGYREFAELLLARGAKVDAKSAIGITPLHWAAGKNRRDVVELLIVHGADVNSKSKDGAVPLHIAVEQNHLDVVALLILRGADINAKNRNGWTPLHVATQERHWEVANLLRKNGGVE